MCFADTLLVAFLAESIRRKYVCSFHMSGFWNNSIFWREKWTSDGSWGHQLRSRTKNTVSSVEKFKVPVDGKCTNARFKDEKHTDLLFWCHKHDIYQIRFSKTNRFRVLEYLEKCTYQKIPNVQLDKWINAPSLTAFSVKCPLVIKNCQFWDSHCIRVSCHLVPSLYFQNPKFP